jgi:hypothetical protein
LQARSLEKYHAIFVLIKTDLTPKIAAIGLEWRHWLVSKVDFSDARMATGHSLRGQMSRQQNLLQRLALVRHSVQQNIVTDEQGFLGRGPDQPDADRQTVCVGVLADVIERVAERR